MPISSEPLIPYPRDSQEKPGGGSGAYVEGAPTGGGFSTQARPNVTEPLSPRRRSHGGAFPRAVQSCTSPER